MNLSSLDQALQVVALFLAVVEFILGLYVLMLNARHTANRYVSGLLLLGAITTLAEGLLIGASNATEAYLPTVLLAATVVPVQPALLIVAVVLLKPGWMPFAGLTSGRGRWRWLWVGLYAFALVPPVLTLIDVTLGTRLWYTGLDPATYQGGPVGSVAFTQGSLAGPIKLLAFQILPLLTFVPLIYVAFRDKKATPLNRRLAGLLLVQQVSILAIALGTREILPSPLPDLLPTAIFVFTYAYVIFQQMVSERRAQRGRLRTRLTALTLVVAIPLLAAVPLLLSLRGAAELERNALDRLEATSGALSTNVSVWLDYNVRALHEMAALQDIVSMEAERQKPVLETMATAYPHMYLVSTTDLDGINVARNDAEASKDYSDRLWFQGARDGAALTFQLLVGRTSGEPALVASAPIRDQTGNIIGVAMYASDLNDITNEVLFSKVGESGFAYVIDAENRVVVHPDPAYSAELRDLGTAPPVVALRQGTRGLVAFTDENGQRWQAYVDEIDHGWGLIVQQPEAELLDVLRTFQTTSMVLISVGAIILLLLTWLTMGQAFRPIETLTGTAAQIAAGDLDAEAQIEGGDEISTLARTFNDMTGQLRGLIGNLERRVADRTHDLEERSRYLEATAEVGRAAASILDANQLIGQVVDLICERFGLYYVGLFLLDETGEWAVLRAGTGAAGRAMLARRHRIHVGEGMIGWSAAHGESRVALEAGADAVRLATSELPETRSEAALPLRSRGEVLGALSVQATEPGFFDEETMAVLQTMADQVAVAISNAQLFQQAQEALEAERRAYGEIGREAWSQLLGVRAGQGYRCDDRGVIPVGDGQPAQEQEEATDTARAELPELVLPIVTHGRVLARIEAHKADTAEWTEEEIELMRSLGDQLSVALESARLFQDTQRREVRERLVGEATARMRETLDIETVLKTTASEVRQVLDLDNLVIRLAPPETDGAPAGDAKSA